MTRRHLPLLATAAVLLLLYVAAAASFRGFFSWYQFAGFFNNNATLGLAAVGMTFVILAGGIDLSVGAVAALAGMATAVMVERAGWPPVPAMAAATLAGAAFGAGQGALVHAFRLPPFLVTLGGMFLARGTALVLTDEKRIGLERDPFIAAVGDWRWAGDFTLPAALFLAAAAAGIAAARWTPFGRAVYAVGGGEVSARLMGLPVGRTVVGVYALSGFCAALGGVAQVMGTTAGDASAGLMLELDAIAAVVIGGTLLSGGVGGVFGTVLGVLILGMVSIVPTRLNLDSWWARIAVGLLLLAFILLQRVGSGVYSQERG